jgi:magnesium transporter
MASADRRRSSPERTDMGEVRAAVFQGGKVIEHGALDAAMLRHQGSAFVWIEVLNPVEPDLAVLQERFMLHSLAVRDALRPAQIPKVDVYDGQIFVVLKVARLMNDEIEYADIDAFISGRHIITVRHDEDADPVRARAGFPNALRPTRPAPDFVLHAIMDVVVNGYFPVVQMIEDDVLAMEQRLLDAFLDRGEVTRLFQLRREAIHLQHVLTRMSDVCGKLINLEVPCIGTEAKPYFRDVQDQLMRLDGMIGGLVDVIRAVFEASNLLEQQRQGAATRKLAGWAAIVGAPTAIAAIYGMNFPHVPGLHAPQGYAVVVGMMLATCVGLYVRLRKLRWL